MRIEGLAHLIFIDRLIEALDDDGAAGELDPFRNPAREDDERAGENDHPRQDDCVPAPAEKIEVGVGENMHG